MSARSAAYRDEEFSPEFYTDDPCVYTSPDGVEIPLYQPAWEAVELAAGGVILIRETEWYDEGKPRVHQP